MRQNIKLYSQIWSNCRYNEIPICNGYAYLMNKKVNVSTSSGANVESVSLAVSSRIKEHRKKQKLSLDFLAKKAGVSKGMLVEVEKGTANPSISILCKLSAALGISVAEIVNVAQEPKINVIQAEDIPVLWQGPSGGKACLLAGTKGPDMIELWQWTIMPGEKFESSGHPHGTNELLHVDQGKLTLDIDGEKTELKQGSSAIARTDMPHQYINNTSDIIIFTMCVAELHR